MFELNALHELDALKSENANSNAVIDIDKERFAKYIMSGYGERIGILNGNEGKKTKIPFSWKVKSFLKRIFKLESKKKESLVDTIANETIHY